MYVAIANSEHTRTKGKSPQTKGIGGRLQKTMLNEFSRLPCRKKISTRLGELPTDLEEWRRYSNEERVPQGRWCFGRTPQPTFIDTIPLAKEKLLAA